ncbi:MAG: hypothetical protein ACLT98_00770 [Eggerthellaceae bacterium]
MMHALRRRGLHAPRGETANVQTASSEGALRRGQPHRLDDAVAAYVREACALGDAASVTVTSADAPSKPVTLKSGDKSVTARYAREKVTVKVVEDVSCIFPLKSLGVKAPPTTAGRSIPRRRPSGQR